MVPIIQYMKLIQDGMLAMNRIIHSDKFRLFECASSCRAMTDLNYLEGIGCALVDYTKSVKDIIDTPFAEAAVVNVKSTYAALESAMEAFDVVDDADNFYFKFDPRKVCDLTRFGDIADAIVSCTTLWENWPANIRNAYDPTGVVDVMWKALLSISANCRYVVSDIESLPADARDDKRFSFSFMTLSEQKYFSEEELKRIHEEQIAKAKAEADAKEKAELAEKNKEFVKSIIECIGGENFKSHCNKIDPKYARGISEILKQIKGSADEDKFSCESLWKEHAIMFYTTVGLCESDFFYAMTLMNSITGTDHTFKNLDMMKTYDHVCDDPVPCNACISVIF